ncbi:MAG TPA: hypothetical protein VH590_15325 [Ktedonobacterales bacterium]|jgi:hypothetical protein
MMYLAFSKEISLIADMPAIIAVRLPDGELGATLRSLCDLVDISRQGQLQRIHRNPSLAEALQEASISTPGGPQQAEVLLNWAISIWATGLQTTRLPRAKQTAVKVLQREAFAAIRQAFAEPENTEAPAPEAPAPEASQYSLHRVRQDLLQAAQGIINAAEGIGHFDGEHQALVERVTALEGGAAGPTIGVEPQRLAQVYLFANRLRQRRSWPITKTLAGLAEHFHVTDVFDLPEKNWPAVLEWFESLLEDW